MDSVELAALFRSEVRDEATPYLWSAIEVASYIDDAQKMFCRLDGGIADATSALTSLAVLANAEYVTISPLILKIRNAMLSPSGRELEILNFEDLQSRRPFEDYGARSGVMLDGTVGEVRALVSGMEANKLRLLRIPSENITIKLIVYRMPLTTITSIGTHQLEIAEHHHRHLMLWMKHLAHLKQDAETYDRGRAEQFRAEFLAYCDRAKAEREKREHKYRTVSYGGY